MKRSVSVMLLIALVISLFVVSAQAAETSNDIICFADGSYISIEIQKIDNRASGSVSGSKTYTYKDSTGEVEWKAVLQGTFTYTGSSATCTASSCNISITDTSWYVVSKSATKSGNSACAELTMGLKTLGVTVKKVPVSMTLSCDANGNLS